MVVIRRKFSRTSSHRKALIRNLVTSTLKHGQIKTTVAKAKEARRYVDKMIALAKRNTLHSYRQIQSFVTCKDTIQKLYKEYVPRFERRNGGYSRMLLAGYRKGDRAPMAILEVLREDHVSVSYKKRRAQLAKAKASAAGKPTPAETPAPSNSPASEAAADVLAAATK